MLLALNYFFFDSFQHPNAIPGVNIKSERLTQKKILYFIFAFIYPFYRIRI